MRLLDMLSGGKKRQIDILQGQLNALIFDKKNLETKITSLQKQCESFNSQVHQVNNEKSDLEARLKHFEKERKQLNSQIRALSKELEKNEIEMEELKSILATYKSRFGEIPLNVVTEEGKVTDYDSDKSFFDVLEKKKKNPFSNKQVKAIRYPCEKHMCIIAGAGSGKTETICAKAAYLVTMNNVAESKICMITFTTKAANEMQDRVCEFLGVSNTKIMIGTFHKVFARIMIKLFKQFPILRQYEFSFGDPDENEQQYREILNKLIHKHDLHVLNKHGDKNIEERISYWINLGYSCEEMVENISTHFDNVLDNKSSNQGSISERFKRMLDDLNTKKKEKKIQTYDDCLVNFYEILNQHPSAKDYVRASFDYIFIDEFQDTNQLQMDIINLLCPIKETTQTKLIIVGDDDQSIYAFRGSDPVYIKNFDESDATETFDLMTNYRSKSKIVKASNLLISYNRDCRIEKSMECHHDDNGDAFTVPLEDTNKEADWIIKKSEKLGMDEPFKYKDDEGQVIRVETPNYTKSVVIYRSVGQLQGIIRTLDVKNTPYVIENKNDLLGIFNIRKFKIVFDTWVELLNNDNSSLTWKKVLSNIAANYYITEKATDFYISALNLQTLDSSIINDFHSFLKQNTKSFNNTDCVKPYLNHLLTIKNGKGVKITDFIDYLFEFPLIKANVSKEDLEYIRKECETYNSVSELKEYYKRLKEKKKQMKKKIDLYFAKKYNALYLLTIHKSKGLAFDNVFVIGCYEGGIPASRAVDLKDVNVDECKQKAEPPTTIEEERRLMYVAVTRARKNVYVTFPITLQGKPCKRSRFIEELYLPFIKK